MSMFGEKVIYSIRFIQTKDVCSKAFKTHFIFKAGVQNMGNGIIFFFAIVEYDKGMIELGSRCSLPTGSEALNQKSKNVKSSATLMQTTTWFSSASVALNHNYFHKNYELVVSPCKDVAIDTSLRF